MAIIEIHARQPTTGAWAIIRQTDRNRRLADQRTAGPNTATPAGPAAPGHSLSAAHCSPTSADSDQRLDAVQVSRARPSRERTPLTDTSSLAVATTAAS